MYCHKRHHVAIFVVLLVLVGEQGHVLHELRQAYGDLLSGHLVNLFVGELHDGVQELLYVLYPHDALRGVLLLQHLYQAYGVGDVLRQFEGRHLADKSLEALYECGEVHEFPCGACVEVDRLLADGCQHIPDGAAAPFCYHLKLLFRGVANSSRGIVDDSQQSLLVERVYHYAEVSE